MGISDFLSRLFFDSAIENQLKHELSTLIIRLDFAGRNLKTPTT